MSFATAEVDTTAGGDGDKVTVRIGPWFKHALPPGVAKREDEETWRESIHRLLDALMDVEPLIEQGHVYSIALHP